jgi:hypothetical protein
MRHGFRTARRYGIAAVALFVVLVPALCGSSGTAVAQTYTFPTVSPTALAFGNFNSASESKAKSVVLNWSPSTGYVSYTNATISRNDVGMDYAIKYAASTCISEAPAPGCTIKVRFKAPKQESPPLLRSGTLTVVFTCVVGNVDPGCENPGDAITLSVPLSATLSTYKSPGA